MRGGYYTHWKSPGRYRVMGMAEDAQDHSQRVVYRDPEGGWWTRGESNFRDLLCDNPSCDVYGIGLGRVAGGGDGLCKHCGEPVRPRFVKE